MGDGEVLDVPDAVVGPMPSDWTADDEGCADTTRTVFSAPVQIKLKAPSTPGNDYQYDLMFARSLSTGGHNDGIAFSRTPPALSILVDVVANTPPVLDLPADMTVEGDTTGGWTAAYAASATDAEDAPDPTPTCAPAVGDLLGLGKTTISCSVTDSGHLSDTGSFEVTVQDTTAPDIAGHADVHVTTSDAGGRAVTFETPAATDVVDPTPSVGCDPASGSNFPVGSTTVTCTATDSPGGNHASTSFAVVVDLVVPHTASASWGEPVGNGDTFQANRGRTIPFKVSLSVDGIVRTTGDARLAFVPCGSTDAERTMTMAYSGGRWNASSDTSLLASSCYDVVASIDGLVAGHVGLAFSGAEPAKAAKPKK